MTPLALMSAADREQHSVGDTRCLACGGSGFTRPWPSRLPWLAECGGCGFRLVSPQPTEAELAGIYGADYFAGFGVRDEQDTPYHRMMRLRGERVLEQLERHVSPGRVLDVGCGLGDFLEVAQARGWDCRGVEPNPAAAESVQQRLPGRVVCASIEEFLRAGEEPEESFELITLLDVLEHLRSPEDVLRGCRRLLKPGGLLALTTINRRSRLARGLGHRWPHYHRDHLWYFCPDSLTSLLNRCGWRIISCTPPRKTFTLDYILHILAAAPAAPILSCLSQTLLKFSPSRLLPTPFSLTEGLLILARPSASSPTGEFDDEVDR